MTPIYIAAVMGHTNCVGLLLARGADPTIKAQNTHYNIGGCSALRASFWFANIECYKLMKNHIQHPCSKDPAAKYLLTN